MNHLILSTSLNPESRSRRLAGYLYDFMGKKDTEWVDLSTWDLPLCDGGSAYKQTEVQDLYLKVDRADAVIVATPIYNFSVSASAKNALELTGSAWKGKVVGLLCAAGGQGSYMAGMPFLNSLMLDYHCFVLPHFVYASGNAFDGTEIIDEDVYTRLRDMAKECRRVTQALGRTQK